MYIYIYLILVCDIPCLLHKENKILGTEHLPSYTGDTHISLML